MSPSIAKTQPNRRRVVTWPEAVMPAAGYAVIADEGYRTERYHNRQTGVSVPALVAAADRNHLLDLFLALLDPLGSVVDVYLESSHTNASATGRCLRRESIDVPVLASYLCDFEDCLLNDGCTAVTVAGLRSPVEVQLDEHKHLIVYAWERKIFARIMKDFGLRRRDDLVLLFDVPHVHRSAPEHADQHSELANCLGMTDYRRVVTG
ncbi:MAG: hypothetical protein ACJ8C4_12130 [Gemmataceae bacterium]